MKRLIDIASIRRHPRAGEAMVELLEYRGAVLDASEATRRFPTLAEEGLSEDRPWFVEILVKDGRESLVGATVHDRQEPYCRTRQRVFEIEHRAGFPSVVATYPEFEYEYLPLMVACPSCGTKSPDNTLEIDCDGDGIIAPCPVCAAAMPIEAPMEETIEQALRRAGMAE